MPPRTRRTAARGRSSPNVSVEASAQVERAPVRGRTRGRGRGHVRQTPIEREETHRAEEMGEQEHAEHATPQATMQEMMAAGFQELQTELQLHLDRQLRSLLGERTVEREE